jgi:AAA domain
MERFDSGRDWNKEYEEAKKAAPKQLPQPIEYLAFSKTPMEKPKPLIDGLLDCGSRILFGGGSKTFKTWMQCDLALSLATGTPWLGFTTHKVRVLYVNLELKDYYMQKRLADIRAAKVICVNQDELFVWNLRGVCFSRHELVEKLLKLTQQLEIAIVFIDPFYKLLSPLEDENNQTQMGEVLRAFDPLGQADVTTSLGIHYSKGNQAAKEPEDRISGAGTITRDCDNAITLTKHEEKLAFTIDFIVRDHAPIDSFVIRWEAPIMVQTDLDPAKLKRIDKRLRPGFAPEELLLLIKLHDDELSTNELVDLAEEKLGWSSRTIFNKLKLLKRLRKVFLSVATDKWNIA